jgi:DNA topoisomerase-3
MGDENVDLIKTIYDKLKAVYPSKECGSDARLITSGNKHLFNSAALCDHHALIPLAELPSTAAPQEVNVYNLVLERFFTVLKPHYVYNSISIIVNFTDLEYKFAGSGIEVLQEGWTAGKDTEDSPRQDFSTLKDGASYPLVSINREEKFTEAKKHFTFTSILRLMENPRNEEGRLSGLGTPATRGGILQTLFDRGYTILHGKNILITDKGKFLVETLQKHEALKKFISIPETTRWEEKLHADTLAFIDGIKTLVREMIKNPIDEKYHMAETSLGNCPLCGSPVREGQKNYYCSAYKDGCRFVIWKEVSGAAISAFEANSMLSGKKTRLKKCKNKDGKSFAARFYLKNGSLTFEFE